MGNRQDEGSCDGRRAPFVKSLTRRELMQAAAWVTSGGALAGGLLEPEMLMGAAQGEPASYLTADRIAATPTFKYRPYRSRRAADAETRSWVQIDLGAPQRIDAVRLFPANQRLVPGQDAYYAGEGFPPRFKVEISNEARFLRPTVLVDFTRRSFDNPKDRIVSVPGLKRRARYLRLTVTRMAEPGCTAPNEGAPEMASVCLPQGKYWFALSRIAVVAGEKEISVGRPVTCDAEYGNQDDAQQITRPERIETEYVRRDRPERVTSPATWRPVSYRAQAPVSGVTLAGGIFEKTMRNNIAYLLNSFTVDDLLLQFRERAGKPIPPSARKPDKFWEEDLAGSNAGRFLMGACNTLRWISDAELQRRVDAVVTGIAECRAADGNVMAFPLDTVFYSERGAYTRAWLTHGLIEAGISGSGEAFELLRGNYDLFNRQAFLPDLMRAGVQGGQGMIANTRMYFTPVGRAEDLHVIERYYIEDQWLAELARFSEEQIWQYPYDRPHCYLLTNLEAYMDVYRATGDEKVRDGVKAAWEMYREHWTQPGGSISIIEYNYDPPDARSLTQKLGELCGNSFWTFLSQRFQLIDPEEERYAGEIERSIYNVAIAAQQGTEGLRYHAILEGKKEQGTHINTCCEGQGTRLIGSFPEHIYSVAGDGLYLNLYEPSSIRWNHAGEEMKLRMETKFPFACDVKVTAGCARPTAMKLRVRVPGWATGTMAVMVNDEPAGSGQPGSYLTLDREWKDGDVVRFTLPAGFHVEEYTGVDQIAGHKRYSLTWGPLLMAATGAKDAALRLPSGSSAAELGRFLVAKENAPLRFEVEGNPGVTYMPYMQVEDEEFTCFPVVDAG